ncbi:hypothetical protein ONZ45_g7529 [Pleurotus djamor]|nr:hypothetical protein ONZ45_g7529 [Pleurotus djamor]
MVHPHPLLLAGNTCDSPASLIGGGDEQGSLLKHQAPKSEWVALLQSSQLFMANSLRVFEWINVQLRAQRVDALKFLPFLAPRVTVEEKEGIGAWWTDEHPLFAEVDHPALHSTRSGPIRFNTRPMILFVGSSDWSSSTPVDETPQSTTFVGSSPPQEKPATPVHAAVPSSLRQSGWHARWLLDPDRSAKGMGAEEPRSTRWKLCALVYGFELLAIALQASALQMPLGRTIGSRRRRSLSSREVDISSSQHASPVHNRKDFSYYVNITLGSQTHAVTLDTGSTDLWIPNPTGDFVTVNTTTVTANITYVKGTVSGPIHFAEMSVAGITIPSQAFINVIKSADLSTNEFGLMGLGLMSASPIARSVNRAYGKEVSKELSRSPIHNIFHQNPSLPPFFTMLLGRHNDPDDEQHGALTIGEYVSKYAAIEHTPKLPNLRDDHWAILVDEIRVGNESIPLNSSVPSTPQGKAVAMLDSGFSLPPLPLYVIDRLYASIPGALPMPDEPGYDARGHWLLPCDHVSDLSITIGGVEFPVNPIDLIMMSTITIPGDQDQYAFCSSTFQAAEYALGADFVGETDMILGAAFLRNAYTALVLHPLSSSLYLLILLSN